MKRNIVALAFGLLLAIVAGCTTSLPKADNKTVAGQQTSVAEAVFTYGLAMHDANAYIATCAQVPKPVGCNDRLIAQIKVASAAAWPKLQAAENAVRNLPPGSAGIDLAIADAQAALAFLQGFTAQVPKK